MVLVTQEMQFAKDGADRVVFMDVGVIVDEASPAEFFTRPRHAPREPRPLVRVRYEGRLPTTTVVRLAIGTVPLLCAIVARTLALGPRDCRWCEAAVRIPFGGAQW